MLHHPYWLNKDADDIARGKLKLNTRAQLFKAWSNQFWVNMNFDSRFLNKITLQ